MSPAAVVGSVTTTVVVSRTGTGSMSSAARPVRLVGVSCAGLERARGVEQEGLLIADRRARSLLRGVDRVRDRWGEHAVLRAGALR